MGRLNFRQHFVNARTQGQQVFLGSAVERSSDHAVQPRVVTIRQDEQVRWAIVKAIAVLVMDRLIALQWTTKDPLHHDAVLGHSLAVHRVHAVAAVDGSGLVRPSQVVWIEQARRILFHANSVLIAERPQFSVVARPLSWLTDAARNIAPIRQRRSVRQAWAGIAFHLNNFNTRGIA